MNEKIGLIDVDGHNYPNLPLMKLSAWHKKQGDHVEWYEPFSGLIQEYDTVYMSKVFSEEYTKDYTDPVYAKKIIKGGTGYAIRKENGVEKYNTEADTALPEEIEHIYPDYSLYPDKTKDTAYGFLTRGCPYGYDTERPERKHTHGYCHVSMKEGFCSHKVADLKEFWNGQKNIVLCDPNIMACKDHMELLQQLADSGATVNFNQGLDIKLINEKELELIKRIKIKSIHFAFDRYEEKEIIVPRLRAFKEATGYDKNKGSVMVYILVNFDTTIEQDIERIQICRELNYSPYPMIYDKKNADQVYKKLQRWCNNFIFWKTPTFEEYVHGKVGGGSS